MALNPVSQSVVVSSGASRYPLYNNPAGTATAGSSSYINANIASIDAIIVESHGSADGALTISDHAGTAGTAIVIDVLTASRNPINVGPFGIATGWTGIKVALTGTGLRVRVAFSPA